MLGSTLHLSAGATEISGVRQRADGGASLSLRLAGRRRGRARVALADGEPLAPRVGFRDELERDLEASGVEESDRIPDR